MSILLATIGGGFTFGMIIVWETRHEHVFPSDGLRYGSRRDIELTRRDERRRRRFRGRVRAMWRRAYTLLKGPGGAPAK